MAARRILYLLTWIGCMVFFWAYQQWFAWFALIAVIALPLFSLLISLPTMITAKLELCLPDRLTVGTPCVPAIRCSSVLPTPPWKCAMVLERAPMDERMKLKLHTPLPTDHCAMLTCRVKKAKIYDYLGLFSLPMRLPDAQSVTVWPNTVPMKQIPGLERYLSRAWRPKRGGGFAENHELRLYRPGDSVQQIHWKLSAKTGKLILREPMEPEQGRVLLQLDLMGTEEELDRKLGRLLWLGTQLLDLKISYEIECLTANGRESWSISSPETLEDAIKAILSRKCTSEGSIRDRAKAAAWQYYIGGGIDEA
jgi:hypothetical protein